MSEFIVVDYHDTLRAGRVLEVLRRRYPEWKGDLEDALVFVMHAHDQAFSAGWWKEQVRLSDDFLFQARRLIRPGDSAMAVLVKAADPDQVIDEVQRYGGRVLHIPFTSQQDALFQLGSAAGAFA